MTNTYLGQLSDFCRLIIEHQPKPQIPLMGHWHIALGRKYDRILRGTETRYFVERSTGNIYGARSDTTPNLSWYFGNLDRCQLWDWSGFHGTPVHDPDIRPIKQYGPFIHYRLVV